MCDCSNLLSFFTAVNVESAPAPEDAKGKDKAAVAAAEKAAAKQAAADAAAGKITLSANSYAEITKKLSSKTKELAKLEITSSKALASVQTFHTQQKQLFDEFVLLRRRYDEQKTLLLETLWDKCAVASPELSEIPDQEDEETYVEDDDHVGAYNLGEVLGEGQFALVRSCTVSHSRGDEKVHDFNAEYAIKLLSKDRLLSFHSLKRVSNEVKILQALKSPYIVQIKDVIQTKNKLYIVTEKGGMDLFEFFDEHPDGVPESWAREIVACILKGVLYCHQKRFCHRDLKPENILVKFNTEAGTCDSVKLCDFGLASEYSKDKPFTDFCGSPGFFAPEMIINGSYHGDKVDIWSCGCIILELVLGHERFCEHWMGPYDYEVMQDKVTFTDEIKNTLEKLKEVLDFSDELNSFILQFLHLRAKDRSSMRTILNHPWMRLTEEEKVEIGISSTAPSQSPVTGRKASMSIDIDSFDASPISAVQRVASTDSPIPGSPHDSGLANTHAVDQELIRAMYHNQSARERKVYEDFNQDRATDLEKVHLPPIEPQTPNVGQARKILLRGADLANKIANNNQTPAETPVTSPAPGQGNWRLESANNSPQRDANRLGGGSGINSALASPMASSASSPNMHLQLDLPNSTLMSPAKVLSTSLLGGPPATISPLITSKARGVESMLTGSELPLITEQPDKDEKEDEEKSIMSGGGGSFHSSIDTKIKNDNGDGKSDGKDATWESSGPSESSNGGRRGSGSESRVLVHRGSKDGLNNSTLPAEWPNVAEGKSGGDPPAYTR